MLLWTLLACVPPSVLGLGFDPHVPAAREAEVALVGGAGGLLPLDGGRVASAAGAELRVGAGSGVAVSGGGGWVEGGVWSVRGDVEGLLLREARASVDLSVHGGVSAVCDTGNGGICLVGGQVGLGLAGPLTPRLRPFVRVQLNPVVADDREGDPRPTPFLVSTLGLSWRPPVAEQVQGVLTLRAEEVHGFAVPRSALAEDGDGFAVLGELGLRFGRAAASEPGTEVPLPDLPSDPGSPPPVLPRAPP